MATITKSSTAEYFAKNLQQVGFSSPIKAVLTTLKEAVDNSLDACEEAGIAPEILVSVKKVGKGSSRSTDLVEVVVQDNGPGIDQSDIPQVFGQYLASSKFGRGQCSRGQQGIGISAATTWAQLTNASGVKVLSKTKKMRKALSTIVDVDIKGNKGLLKDKNLVDWDINHGTRVEFRIDGRVQLKGDGGLLTYLEGTTLVNPHLTLKYELLDNEPVVVSRVTEDVPKVPAPTLPHPHTMKLGEFMTHAHLYGNMTLEKFLKKGFSRVTEATIKEFTQHGLPKGFLSKTLTKTSEAEFKKVFQAIQDTNLANPSTRSVLTVGEEGLSKSIQRLGEIDFFSVVTRKPRICDFKPVVVEVAIARFLDRPASANDEPVQLLRFANRVPLQFDKGACAITKAVESVNWRSYGLSQPKGSLPQGPYVFAVSMTSPFIKFKNASKETIDASDELVEEIRLALMRAGQKLSRHIKREHKAADLERKMQHIEKFGPILVEGLASIVGAPEKRKQKAIEGLEKLLGRDTQVAEAELEEAESRLAVLKAKQRRRLGSGLEDSDSDDNSDDDSRDFELDEESESQPRTTKKTTSKKAVSKKAASKKLSKTTTKTVAKKKGPAAKGKTTSKKKTVRNKK
ncbi:MAG: DNA topoisomerase VI subunit B [Pseudobdellovibrionaceae bacterium]|nr:DNA topoisomerase VI subunit B [Bdellovibrionales bacterium]USN46198.1 MAG: DNA topoisomerase VI subunit B [Pseudobdellovibrionaceae bacterium]